MAINKVVYGNNTLIDLTDTTATAEDVANGQVFYGKNGVRTIGTGGGEPTDVQINGTSITSSGVANILTQGTYSSTNKLATMADVTNVALKKIPDNSTIDIFTLEDGIYEVEGYCELTSSDGSLYFAFERNHNILSIKSQVLDDVKTVTYWYQKYEGDYESGEKLFDYVYGYGIITENGEWYKPFDDGEINLYYFSTVALRTEYSIAPAYYRTTYSKGDLTMVDGVIYECKQDINTPEEWNSSHWERTYVSKQLEDIKNEIGDVETLLGGI